MESLTWYEFELDLSNCDKLYDYVNRQEFTRPVKVGWNMQDIQHETRLQKDYKDSSKRFKSMMHKMEEAHREAGTMEKDPKKNNIKKEAEEVVGADGVDEAQEATNDRMELLFGKGVFDSIVPKEGPVGLPLWVLPVYHPGDKVKGKLHLDLSEPLEAEQLELEFMGRAIAHLEIHTDKVHVIEHKREPYVEVKDVYWHKRDMAQPGGMSRHALPTSETLPAGRHCLDFEYEIPKDAPASAPPLVDGKWTLNFAHLTYLLKATIEMGKWWSRGNIVLHRGIWVDKPENIALDPENLTPVTVSETMHTGLLSKSGDIECKVKLEGHGAIRNTPIPIMVQIDNETSEDIEVVARVDLKTNYRGGEGWKHLSSNNTIKGDEVSTGPIGPNMANKYQLEVPLDFNFEDGGMDGRLAPVGDFSYCSLIDIQYKMHVEVIRGKLKRNLKMQVPINMGTCNTKTMY